jgi:hypothetical protein
VDLHAQWHDPKEGAVDLDAARWRISRSGQDSRLHVSLTRLSPGTLQLRLRVRRRFFGRWRELPAARVQEITATQQISAAAAELDLQLSAADLGMQQAFAARTLELQATLRDARGKLDQAKRRVYLMPQLQFSLARALRYCAFLPLLPLLRSVSAGEISGDLAVWYGAVNVGLGLVVQEHPLSRFSRLLRGATRGVALALITMAGLVLLQWSLLVRVTNREARPLLVAGATLEPGRSRLMWSWQAPTLQSLNAESGGLDRFALEEPQRSACAPPQRERDGSPWRSMSVWCKPFRLACARENPRDPGCAADRCAVAAAAGGAANVETSRSAATAAEGSRGAASTAEDAEAIELGPNCSIPQRVRTKLESWVVLGREGPDDAHGPPGSLDALPVCRGTYELALSEQRAYSGSSSARAQYAKSFALIVLPPALAGIELRWTNAADGGDNGFVSSVLAAPSGEEPACLAMVPVHNGSFEVELRGAGGGTLRCPSVGSCKRAYSVEQAFALRTPFDGMQTYSTDHGRSLWTPLGDAARAFACDCWGEAEAPKQASLRLSRPAPQGFRMTFDVATLPRRLDLSAGAQRSALQCSHPAAHSVSVQPVQLGYTDTAQRVEVGEVASGHKWPSEWTWLEGDHQAWSCTRDAAKLSLRVDGARTFSYRAQDSGDALVLPVCYLNRSGRVTSQREAESCSDWRPATDEYSQLVLKDHVCSKVLACH